MQETGRAARLTCVLGEVHCSVLRLAISARRQLCTDGIPEVANGEEQAGGLFYLVTGLFEFVLCCE